MRHSCMHALFAGVLATSLAAQVSNADVTIGGKDAVGCQNRSNPPTLSDGTDASARLDFSYDQATGRLTVVVTNTSPVTKGVPNPLVTEVFFSLPPHAVSKVTLVSQTGSAGKKPEFVLGSDTSVPGGIRRACFGGFGVHLGTKHAVKGAIANANADTIEAPPGSWVVGPATFVLDLQGPGVGSLTAQTLASGFSQNAPFASVNAGAKFVSGGRGGAGSGFLGTAFRCAASIWIVGEPRIGNTIQFCTSGGAECKVCILISLHPGPTFAGGFTIPIGFPLLADLSLLYPATNSICIPLQIPNDPGLINTTIYFAAATINPRTFAIDFSERFDLTILP